MDKVHHRVLDEGVLLWAWILEPVLIRSRAVPNLDAEASAPENANLDVIGTCAATLAKKNIFGLEKRETERNLGPWTGPLQLISEIQ